MFAQVASYHHYRVILYLVIYIMLLAVISASMSIRRREGYQLYNKSSIYGRVMSVKVRHAMPDFIIFYVNEATSLRKGCTFLLVSLS